MPENHRFFLEPHYATRRMQLHGIRFDVIKGEDVYHPRNPVLETLPVKEIDYGKLFTYAFRRFGLPNKGSDGYKDIAEWPAAAGRTGLLYPLCGC
jgi:hypothetical protein